MFTEIIHYKIEKHNILRFDKIFISKFLPLHKLHIKLCVELYLQIIKILQV